MKIKPTAADVLARVASIIRTRNRGFADMTGVDFRLTSIAYWAEQFAKGPRMTARYDLGRLRMETRFGLTRGIHRAP